LPTIRFWLDDSEIPDRECEAAQHLKKLRIGMRSHVVPDTDPAHLRSGNTASKTPQRVLGFPVNVIESSEKF
jgi:uncharacterized protein (DUF2249 family)